MNIKHGLYGRKYRKTIMCYKDMIRRCYNSRNASYQYYGGRGVGVDDRWRGPDGVVNFWNDMGERPSGYTLDRIDGTKNYGPQNCRWAPYIVQNNNRPGYCRYYTIFGKTKTIAQWAAYCGIKPGTVYSRLNSGWDITRALVSPKPRMEILKKMPA